jgi:hypothetical protein
MRVSWTPEMVEHGCALRRSGLTYSAIGARLGMSKKQAETKLRMVLDPVLRERSRAIQKAYRERNRVVRPAPATDLDGVEVFIIPEETLADRDARCFALSLRNITQILMGDPPPGYSALELRA